MNLTDEQIENWRKVLFVQFGAYALFMSKEEIQKYKEMLEKKAQGGEIE